MLTKSKMAGLDGKFLKVPNNIASFSAALQDINRFFVDEGDASDVPKVGFSSGGDTNNASGANADDLFEGELDSAL